MEKTSQYFEDESKGQYSTVEDEPMVTFLNKLATLAGTEHVKIYWRKHHNYTNNCDMYWIHGTFPILQHEVSLANACGDGPEWQRRVWLTHKFQRNTDEMTSPIYIVSPAQIEAFDTAWTTWMAAGQDLTNSDWAVAEEILQL